MKDLSKRLYFLVFIVFAGYCICLQAKPVKPREAPEGWVYDYDYETSIVEYLKSQYIKARRENKTAYVYVYTDRGSHCKSIRRMVRKQLIADAFSGAHIVMLSIKQLKRLYKRNPEANFNPPNWVPVIVKVSPKGYLTNAFIFPDKLIYHPENSDIQSYGDPVGAGGRWNLRARKNFARTINEFFNTYNEI